MKRSSRLQAAITPLPHYPINTSIYLMQPSSTSPAYLTNLTPLRGIAALIVLFFHFDLFWGGPFKGTLFSTETTLFVKKGYLLVDFFFVLSGFIMCHVYGRFFADSVQKPAFWQFIKARFARIYPLHLFTLVWAILLFVGILWVGFPLDAREKSVFDLSAIPAHLVLIQAMGIYPGYTWNGPSWTISVEWWMYVLFPFVYGPVSRLTNWGRVIGLAGLLGLYAGLVYGLNVFPQYPWVRSLNVPPAFGGAFMRCALSFSVGMLFYGLFRQRWGQPWLANGYATLGLAGTMALSMHLGLSDLVTVSTFPLIILSAGYGSSVVNNLLTTKLMQRLGDLSFSVYLVNEVLFDSGRLIRYALGLPPLPTTSSVPEIWLYCFGWLALVFGVSALTYRFVEVPARQYLNARFQKPTVTVPVASVAESA